MGVTEPGGDKVWLVPSMVSSEFEPDLGNQQQVVFVVKLCSCALDFSVWTLPCSVEGNHAKVIRTTEEEQVFCCNQWWRKKCLDIHVVMHIFIVNLNLLP